MLKFFRLNDPYRLIPVILILLLIRLPYVLDTESLMFFEIKWLSLGKKLLAGSKMYSEVWDNSGPLASAVYFLFVAVFGKSHVMFGLIAFVITVYQCIIFNDLILRNNAIPENTYVPALIYGILISFSYEYYLLSPQLISLTYLLLSLKNIFSHIQLRAKRDERILYIGLNLGIATLFYLPMGLFFLAVLIIFGLFTGTVTRRYFLLFNGFVLPLVLAGCYYLLNNNFSEFMAHYFISNFNIPVKWYISGQSWLYVLAFPVLYLVFAFFRLAGRTRYTNYQSRLIQVMLLFMIIGVFCFWLARDKSMLITILFIPSVAFFMSHYFLLIRRKMIAELSFLVWFVVMAGAGFTLHKQLFDIQNYISSNVVVRDQTPDVLKGTGVVVLGEDWSIFKKANHVTPYFNWRIAEKIFSELEYYDNQTHILESFRKTPPDFIIDRKGFFDTLNRLFPFIKNEYHAIDEDIYQKRGLAINLTYPPFMPSALKIGREE